ARRTGREHAWGVHRGSRRAARSAHRARGRRRDDRSDAFGSGRRAAGGRGSHCPLLRGRIGRVIVAADIARIPTARWVMRGLLLFALSFTNLHDIWSPDVLPNALPPFTLLREGNVNYDEFVFRPAERAAR